MSKSRSVSSWALETHLQASLAMSPFRSTFGGVRWAGEPRQPVPSSYITPTRRRAICLRRATRRFAYAWRSIEHESASPILHKLSVEELHERRSAQRMWGVYCRAYPLTPSLQAAPRDQAASSRDLQNTQSSALKIRPSDYRPTSSSRARLAPRPGLTRQRSG